MSIEHAVESFNNGGVIAYPTEAVFGLGCDPDNEVALQKLLDIKKRDPSKGLILVAADYGQLLPYVDDLAIPQHKRFDVLSKWPGPITWVVPAAKSIQPLLRGQYQSIAIRVPDHQGVRDFCRAIGKPIVSTSANISGMEPCTSAEQVKAELGNVVDSIVDGKTNGAASPSKIFDVITGKQLR